MARRLAHCFISLFDAEKILVGILFVDFAPCRLGVKSEKVRMYKNTDPNCLLSKLSSRNKVLLKRTEIVHARTQTCACLYV